MKYKIDPVVIHEIDYEQGTVRKLRMPEFPASPAYVHQQPAGYKNRAQRRKELRKALKQGKLTTLK